MLDVLAHVDKEKRYAVGDWHRQWTGGIKQRIRDEPFEPHLKAKRALAVAGTISKEHGIQDVLLYQGVPLLPSSPPVNVARRNSSKNISE